MALRRGTGTIQRVHARNYIPEQADKRLDEVVHSYQQQGANALGVDYYEVELFRQLMSTTVCTCKRAAVVPEDHAADQLPIVSNGNGQQITITHDSPLFGHRYTAATQEEIEGDQMEDEVVDSVDGPVVEQLMSATANCGLCFKSGFVPGYEHYGWQRTLFTTHNVADTYGYHVLRGETPNVFDQTDSREGFVQFDLQVPARFKQVLFALFDNTDRLDEDLYDVTGAPLTLQHFRAYAGTTLTFRVRAERFTHVVIEIDLGLPTLHANLSQGTRTVDWSTFNTLSNINVVLPPYLPELHVTDVIWVPRRNIALKVADRPELRTARGKPLDWSVGTRVLQPQEPLGQIAMLRTMV